MLLSWWCFLGAAATPHWPSRTPHTHRHRHPVAVLPAVLVFHPQRNFGHEMGAPSFIFEKVVFRPEPGGCRFVVFLKKRCVSSEVLQSLAKSPVLCQALPSCVGSAALVSLHWLSFALGMLRKPFPASGGGGAPVPRKRRGSCAVRCQGRTRCQAAAPPHRCRLLVSIWPGRSPSPEAS